MSSCNWQSTTTHSKLLRVSVNCCLCVRTEAFFIHQTIIQRKNKALLLYFRVSLGLIDKSRKYLMFSRPPTCTINHNKLEQCVFTYEFLNTGLQFHQALRMRCYSCTTSRRSILKNLYTQLIIYAPAFLRGIDVEYHIHE